MIPKCDPVLCTIHKRIGKLEELLHNKWLSEDPKIQTFAGAEIRWLLDLDGLIYAINESRSTEKK